MGVGDIMAKENSKKSNKKGNNRKSSYSKKSNVIKVNNENNVSEKNNDKIKTVNKARNNLIYSNNDSTDELSKLIKIVLIVTGVMIVFYGVTTFITKKVNAVKTAKLGKSSKETAIQYDNIIIGSMFNIEGHYFVLIEKEDDDNSSEYDMLLKSIEANDESLKIYTAGLDNSFNKSYLAEESNYDSDLSNFRVSGTTLVEVDNHKIIDTFDSYDSIKEKLNELK